DGLAGRAPRTPVGLDAVPERPRPEAELDPAAAEQVEARRRAGQHGRRAPAPGGEHRGGAGPPAPPRRRAAEGADARDARAGWGAGAPAGRTSARPASCRSASGVTKTPNQSSWP